MTGSGKTGLGIALIEEAAIDGLPVLAIDPKGDLVEPGAHASPACRAAEFAPWVNPDEARAQQLTPEAFADAEADPLDGRAGRLGPGRRPHRPAGRGRRRRRLHARAAAPALPLSILETFQPPPRGDPRRAGAARRSACSRWPRACCRWPASTADADDQPRARAGRRRCCRRRGAPAATLDLASLIGQVQSPPVAKVGVLDLESFFPATDRFALAMRLNNVLAAPGFAAWLEGDAARRRPRCSSRPTGKPRVAVVSIAHLGDAERMFFVALLLEQVLAWVRGAARHDVAARRALHGRAVRLPAADGESAEQGAAAHAAQAGARLRPRLRAGDAEPGGPRLQGARPTPAPGSSAGCRPSATRPACSTGSRAWPRARARASTASALDRLLSSLDKRVFLLHNVHEREPLLFQTRWAMSYLRGPDGTRRDPGADGPGAARGRGTGASGRQRRPPQATRRPASRSRRQSPSPAPRRGATDRAARRAAVLRARHRRVVGADARRRGAASPTATPSSASTRPATSSCGRRSPTARCPPTGSTPSRPTSRVDDLTARAGRRRRVRGAARRRPPSRGTTRRGPRRSSPGPARSQSVELLRSTRDQAHLAPGRARGRLPRPGAARAAREARRGRGGAAGQAGAPKLAALDERIRRAGQQAVQKESQQADRTEDVDGRVGRRHGARRALRPQGGQRRHAGPRDHGRARREPHRPRGPGRGARAVDARGADRTARRAGRRARGRRRSRCSTSGAPTARRSSASSSSRSAAACRRSWWPWCGGPRPRPAASGGGRSGRVVS